MVNTYICQISCSLLCGRVAQVQTYAQRTTEIFWRDMLPVVIWIQYFFCHVDCFLVTWTGNKYDYLAFNRCARWRIQRVVIVIKGSLLAYLHFTTWYFLNYICWVKKVVLCRVEKNIQQKVHCKKGLWN